MVTSWMTKFAGVAVAAVLVSLYVEANHIVALGEQSLGPAAKATEQVDGEGGHFAVCRWRSA